MDAMRERYKNVYHQRVNLKATRVNRAKARDLWGISCSGAQRIDE
jgi:hypothetical protein